jgi:HlyD family type I secretion membrane fusion protein
MTDTHAPPVFTANPPPIRGLFAKAEWLREGRLPATARAVMLTVVVFLGAALVFAALTPLRELVRAPGTIVPSGRPVSIEHLSGGRVTEVHVSEGMQVLAGELLARLDQPELTRQIAAARESLSQVEYRRAAIASVLGRLQHGASPQPVGPDAAAKVPGDAYADARHALFLARQQVISGQIATADRTIASLERARTIAMRRVEDQSDQVTRLSRLAAQGHIAEFTLFAATDRLGELSGELAASEVALARAVSDRQAQQARMAENALEHRETLLREAFELDEKARSLKNDLQGLQELRDALAIRAPRDGIIQHVAFPLPGEVIGPDTELFRLLPSSVSLMAEIRISPQDIGHVAVGDSVAMKLQTFDFRRFGGVSGRIESLSPTSVEQPDGTSHFRATIRLDDNRIGPEGDRRPIRPGMEVAAEIQTNTRTILQYILKPLDASLRAVLTER